MSRSRRFSTEFIAIGSAAVASSLLAFLGLAISGWLGPPTSSNWPMEILVILSVVLIWGPAFALVPAGIIGVLVERPYSRRLIERGTGGFVEHLLLVTGTSLMLWLALRVAVVAAGPQSSIFDPLSFTVFLLIGLCSALSWWFLVVRTGRLA